MDRDGEVEDTLEVQQDTALVGSLERQRREEDIRQTEEEFYLPMMPAEHSTKRIAERLTIYDCVIDD
jgi:hypothetical protein